MATDYMKRWGPSLYAIFRILIGLLLLEHGLQKLFGIFGGSSVVPVTSWLGVAGMAEMLIGIALVFGMLTRLAAAGGVLYLLIVYFSVHFSPGTLAGWVPIMNQGELALVYIAAFLALIARGGGIWSIERHLSEAA